MAGRKHQTPDHRNQRVDGGSGALESGSCQGGGGEPSVQIRGGMLRRAKH